eukprot:CAMPEP_0170501804 /NCGR_PEP_ID=MMETSP0208-20121228/39457_1 /TAXON_ID=197538 /ORGANISM="Strombidium inclinatum, Strain S3" /LENGTH=37 /DNA_ID= /DNA_START= /DNA_END= /DNA_ORIENTATION=
MNQRKESELLKFKLTELEIAHYSQNDELTEAVQTLAA